MKTRLASLAVALAATVVGAALWAPQARADVAPEPTVDSSLIIIAVAVVGVVIVGAIAWFVLRAVRRGRTQASPEEQPAAPSSAGPDEDR
jgi:divalent metal cation (Fe/Co/Zn/Cd) transporter